MNYYCDRHDAVAQVPLDSLTAVYHRRSGQTHLVADPVPELLNVLAGGPQTVDGMLAALGLSADVESRLVLTERMNELVATGLVSRA